MAIPRDLALIAPRDGGAAIDPAVTRGIRQAARATGIDFGYLMAEAGQESGFRADARATTSSAAGLFQFTEGTWLEMVRRHGAEHGLADQAAQIAVDGAGRPVIADGDARKAILDLRHDPRLAAVFAGEYARDNKAQLERTIGRVAGNAELYLAHFLGAGGAGTFLKAAQRDGSAAAAELLPEAAAANRAVFYTDAGTPRSVADIYRSFSSKIEAAAARFSAAAPSAERGSAEPGLTSAVGRSRPTGVAARLTAPVRAMFDVLTLSALRLLGGTPSAPPTVKPRSTTSI
jgi:hypothetical protein